MPPCNGPRRPFGYWLLLRRRPSWPRFFLGCRGDLKCAAHSKSRHLQIPALGEAESCQHDFRTDKAEATPGCSPHPAFWGPPWWHTHNASAIRRPDFFSPLHREAAWLAPTNRRRRQNVRPPSPWPAWLTCATALELFGLRHFE